jgi:Family of unknown function (DUF6289)
MRMNETNGSNSESVQYFKGAVALQSKRRMSRQDFTEKERTMKTSIRRHGARIALALAAACVIGAAIAAAPGPTSNGEFYYYFDANGNTIGYRAINCNGTLAAWGKTSARYSNGYALCLPVD